MHQSFDTIVLAHAAGKATVYRQLVNAQVSCPDVSVTSYWRFVRSLYEPDALVLTARQAAELWRQAVEAVDIEPPILSPLAAANAAMQAHELLLREDISEAALKQYPDPNVPIFLQWRQKYRDLEKKYAAINSAELERRAIQHAGRLRGQQIGYFGFDHVPAQTQRLFKALGAQRFKLSPQCGKPKQVQCDHPEAEVEACLQFCEDILAQDKNSVIAVAAACETERYQRLLRRYSVAQQLPIHGLTRKFSDVPDIACLLAWAQCFSGEVALETIESAFFRPFVRRTSEDFKVVQDWVHQCRMRGQRQADLKAISDRLSEPLREILNQWRSVRLSPTTWSEILLQWAAQLGMDLDRVDRPLYQWMTQINQLALVHRKIRGQDYVRIVQQEASAPISPPLTGAGIHFLSLHELLGGAFDAIWILGTVSNAWPASVQRNPLIPVALAKDKALPRSSADRELQYALWQRQLILCMSARLIASYPRAIDLEVQLPSALIKDWAPYQASIQSKHVIHEASEDRWEIIQDDSTQPLKVHKQRGGTALFTDMTQCPFRAFLRHRIGLEEPETVAWGVEAKHRGSWYHQILERFWQATKTQAQLAQYSREARRACLSTLAQETWPALEKQLTLPAEICQALRSVEIELAVDILDAILTLDLQRAPFEVEAVEQSRIVPIGPLQFKIKIDRIDRLSDGTRVVIDYKTGVKQLSHLKPDGLTEPQLPIYAVFVGSNEPVHAVAFAVVRLDRTEYIGLADEAVHFMSQGTSPLKTLPYARAGFEHEHWDDLIQAWRRRIHQLVKQFQSGDCRVPGTVTNLCQYCQFQAVCRRDLLEPVDRSRVLWEEVIAAENTE